MTATKLALEELAANIKSDLAQADRRVMQLSDWQATQPEGHELYAAAMYLHQLYGAIESVIERSVRLFDGVSPSGSDWHVRLLGMASVELPGLRPVILPADDAVDEMRRFRHRLRKRYDDDMRPELLHPVLRSALAAWPRIRASLEQFKSFVEDCSRNAE